MARPKLPKGMFQRGRSFWTRDRRNGKDKWIPLGRDREEALRQYREYLFDRDGFRRRGDYTVEQLGRRWLETYVPTARNAAGQQLAVTWMRKYLVPFLGSKMVERVSQDDLRSYRLWLERQTTAKSKKLALQTVAHVLSDARCMFHWAEDNGYMGSSPVPRRLLPRIPRRLPDALTAQEISALGRLKDPYGFIIRLGLATGLRWSDLTRVRREHVRDGMLEVEIGKTGEVRRIPLRPEIEAEIRSRIGPLVAFSPKSKGSFTRNVRRLSGVSRFHIHQLRHSAAMRLLGEGWRIEGVQEILGHKSVSTTERYARLSEAMLRSEAERLWGTSGSERKTVAER